MSLTIPYSTAVNCKFVNLPDSLATDANTLKLYNIDGGGGGGDSYTKSESDARFLQLATGTNQTVTQTPEFGNGLKVTKGGIQCGQETVNSGNFVTVFTEPQTVGRKAAFPQMSADGQIIVTTPTSSQTISTVRINTLNLNGASVDGLVTTITGASNTKVPSEKAVSAWGNSKYLMLDGGNQTINSVPIFFNGYNALQCTFFNTTRNGWCTLRSQVPVGADKFVYIPDFNGSTSDFIVTAPLARQTLQSIRINTLNLNGSNVDGLVTTITEASNSDTAVPSVKAVKDYVVSSTNTFNYIFINGVGSKTKLASAQTDGDATVTMPSVTVSNYFITDNPTVQQTVQRIKINNLTLSSGNSVNSVVTSISGSSDTSIPTEKAVANYAIPKTDIVTTVTGASDTKVPSEKAVKNYVAAYMVDRFTYSTFSGSTIPEGYFTRDPTVDSMRYFELKCSDTYAVASTYIMYSIRNLPDTTNIRVQIDGLINLQGVLKVLKQNFLILGGVDVAVTQLSGTSWNDFDPAFPSFTLVKGAAYEAVIKYVIKSGNPASKAFFKFSLYYQTTV